MTLFLEMSSDQQNFTQMFLRAKTGAKKRDRTLIVMIVMIYTD